MAGEGYVRPTKKFCDIRDLVVLRLDSANVRAVYLNGDPWFAAEDACVTLELINSRMALQMPGGDEKGVNLTYTSGGNQNMRVISELGFYKLTTHSRKVTMPGMFAHRFSNWAFRNAILGTRKTGTYDIPRGVL